MLAYLFLGQARLVHSQGMPGGVGDWDNWIAGRKAEDKALYISWGWVAAAGDPPQTSGETGGLDQEIRRSN